MGYLGVAVGVSTPSIMLIAVLMQNAVLLRQRRKIVTISMTLEYSALVKLMCYVRGGGVNGGKVCICT